MRCTVQGHSLDCASEAKLNNHPTPPTILYSLLNKKAWNFTKPRFQFYKSKSTLSFCRYFFFGIGGGV